MCLATGNLSIYAPCNCQIIISAIRNIEICYCLLRWRSIPFRRGVVEYRWEGEIAGNTRRKMGKAERRKINIYLPPSAPPDGERTCLRQCNKVTRARMQENRGEDDERGERVARGERSEGEKRNETREKRRRTKEREGMREREREKLRRRR